MRDFKGVEEILRDLKAFKRILGDLRDVKGFKKIFGIGNLRGFKGFEGISKERFELRDSAIPRDFKGYKIKGGVEN